MDISRVTKRLQTLRLGHEEVARRSGISIGSDCRIYSDVASSEPWLVTIGDRVTISTNVTIVTHDGSGWLYRDDRGRRFRYAPVSIGDNVFVGAGSTLMPGVRLGDNVVVGAGSVVTASVPSGSVVAGSPARLVGSWDDLMKRMHDWSAESDMRGESYRERVDSVVEGFLPDLTR